MINTKKRNSAYTYVSYVSNFSYLIIHLKMNQSTSQGKVSNFKYHFKRTVQEMNSVKVHRPPVYDTLYCSYVTGNSFSGFASIDTCEMDAEKDQKVIISFKQVVLRRFCRFGTLGIFKEFISCVPFSKSHKEIWEDESKWRSYWHEQKNEVIFFDCISLSSIYNFFHCFSKYFIIV